MDPENQELDHQDNPTGEAEVKPPEIAVTDGTPQETPAAPTDEEQDEITALQLEIEREFDPDKRAVLEKRQNAAFADIRRRAKAAEQAREAAERERDEALRLAEYQRGRAESQQVRPKPEPEQEPAIEVPAHLIPPKPREEDFEDYAQFMVATGEWAAEKRYVEREFKRQVENQRAEQARKAEAFQATLQRGQEKYPDFLMTIQNPNLAITPVMAEAIGESDIGDELAYHFGKNPAEAMRLARLPEKSMLRELGKIEAKLSAPPPQQKTKTTAPDPITPSGAPSFTPVPKKIEDMTQDEYNAYMNQKEFGPNWRGGGR